MATESSRNEFGQTQQPPEHLGTARRGRLIGLVIGVSLLFLMLFLPPPADLSTEAWRVAAVGLLMAIFWVTEAIPLPATALIPLPLFPLLGIAPIKDTASPYANPVIFLFMGGFVVALAMERWRLHERIALMVLKSVGDRMDYLVGGFMLATAVLSMWVSNTATTLMMLPIALSIVSLYKNGEQAYTNSIRGRPIRFPSALLLSVAYGATAGGMATLVGTPPNAFLAGFMRQSYGIEIGFAQWMAMALPLSILMLFIIWWLITRVIFDLKGRTISGAHEVIKQRAARQGQMSSGEVRTAILFVLLATAWVLRPWLNKLAPGMNLNDSVIAMSAAILAFLIPVDIKRGQFLMNWEWAQRLPFGVLILFGGGLTLAAAISRSGLADWIGTQLGVVGDLPPIFIVMTMIATLIFLTELTSNTATTAAFLPIVAALAISLGEHPLLLVAPAALAASCAFMLPVATPPNAIVFASGHLSIAQMARAGVLLNLIAILMITMIAYTALLIVFGVQPGVLPEVIRAAAGS
ncbi:MAG: DASS family sodium-coupled anion symporter [Burkholderiales bacterium]|nr:DASS family sodium-coupled anion symporter [Burkholderiales bacterium]